MEYLATYIPTKEGKKLWSVTLWLQSMVQEEEVILLGHQYTTKESNIFGVMYTGVYVPPIINCSMQWKQWESLILLMKLISSQVPSF